MALLFMDGFDHYRDGGSTLSNHDITNYNGFWDIAPSDTRLFQCFSNASGLGRTFRGAGTNWGNNAFGFGPGRTIPDRLEIGIGAYVRSTDNADTRDSYFYLRNGTTNLFSIHRYPSEFEIRAGGTTSTVLYSHGGPLVANDTWTHLELFVSFDDVNGAFELRADGLPIASGSGLDLGTLPCNRVHILSTSKWPTGGGGITSRHYIDDFYIWDTTGDENNSFLGPQDVLLLLPNADGANQDWTLGVGSTDGFDEINNVPPATGSGYIESDTVGDVSDFELSGTSFSAIDVRGVMAMTRANKQGSGTGEMSFGPLLTGDTYLDTEVTTLADSAFSWFRTPIYGENPETSGDWELADIENLRLRFERTA